MKKKDFFGMYFLRDCDLKPERIDDRSWIRYALTVPLCERLLKEGLLFKTEEEANVASKAARDIVSGIAQHRIVREKDIPAVPGGRKKPRIYISGPISGYDLEERRAAFHYVQEMFEVAGYYVFNPMENGLPAEATTAQHMRRDLHELTREDEPYDSIYLMEKWNHSAG